MPHRDPRIKRPSFEEHRRNEPSDVSSEGSSRFIRPSAPEPSTLLEKVRSLFSWIANRVTEEAREEESMVESETSAKRLLSQYSSRDLMRRAKAVIAQVEASQQLLLQEFGPRAQAFIDRYVVPVLEPIQSFVHAGQEGKITETVRGAIGTVELLAMLHDKARLPRKIRDTLELKTRDVILEDIAFLLSYPSEAVEDARVPLRERGDLLRKIEGALQPILLDLEALLSLRPPSTEFIPLFRWRLEVDSKRQRLHDEALQIIDEEIHRNVPLWGPLKTSPTPEISSFLEHFELLAQGEIPLPFSLIDLEEISAHMRRILELESAYRTNEQWLTLFQHMRSYVESLHESAEGEEHEEVLTRIIEHLRAIEQLLELEGL